MSSRLRPFVSRIFKTRIIGDPMAHLGATLTRLWMPLAARLSGFTPIPLGTSVIWTPQNKKQTILDGIDCLRRRDAEMFLHLTTKSKIFMYYSVNHNSTNIYGYMFGLQEAYIKQGAEGVAYFIVQSILVSDAHPSVNQHRKSDVAYKRLKAVPRKTMEWMQRHSFDPQIIKSYMPVVEMWEKRYSR